MKRIKLKLSGYEFKLLLGLVFGLLSDSEDFQRSTTFAVLYIWVKNKILPKYAVTGIKENEKYTLSLDYAQAIALYDFLLSLPKIENVFVENSIRQIIGQLDSHIVNIKNDFYLFDKPTRTNQNILGQ